MEIKTILDPREVLSVGISSVGGKAWNLARLTALGHSVPDWIVITTDSWARNRGILGDIKVAPDHLEQSSNSIQTAVMKLSMDPEMASGLSAWLNSMGDHYFAVRSSVSGEDSDKFSFAGQMESFLYRRGTQQILEAVKLCWASAFSARALQYRIQNDLDVADIRPAVIIQKMIDGDVSGVLFTAHPTTGHRRKALLTATYGLGEGIVSGSVNTDEFTIDYDHFTIETTIGNKDTKIVFDRINQFGTVIEKTDAETAAISCLNRKQVLEIVTTGRAIADAYRQPLDIEWTIQNDRLFILQARPITRLPKPSRNGGRIVWDNSNIQESYCGVTTPLTFSFASMAYATVYEATMRLMKIRREVIAQHQDMLGNLLGFIHGRVYYNINNWYRGLLLLPSFKTNKADMERMMGLEEPVDFIVDREMSGLPMLRRIFLMTKTATHLVLQFRKIAKSVAVFHANFRKHEEWVRSKSLHELEPHELWSLVDYLQDRVLRQWQVPIVNDFYVMMYHGKIRRRLEKAGVDNVDLIQNNLLSGEPDLESSKPTKMLIEIAGMIKEDEELRKIFNETSDSELLLALKVHGGHLFDACERYIKYYGDRVIGELKLETPSLRENPEFMFLILRNYLRDELFDSKRYHERESRIREEAEKTVFSRIKAGAGRLALNRFKKDLAKWRSAVRNRESMRLERTRLFGMFRDIFLALGAYLANHQVIDEKRDIFYLSLDELNQWINGRLVQTGFRNMIASRKIEYEEYKKNDLPNRIETFGPVYHFNDFVQKVKPLIPGQSNYKGLGCYPGLVEGEVRLIMEPNEAKDLNGHILVTLRTDPGWTPLFPSCKGIIVERGSSLSHSAVIARELGIPTIVAVPDITKILKNGDRIQMDGGLGVINKL